MGRNYGNACTNMNKHSCGLYFLTAIATTIVQLVMLDNVFQEVKKALKVN